MLEFESAANNNNYAPEDPLTPDNRAFLNTFLLEEALIGVPETTRSAVELLLRTAVANCKRSIGPELKNVWSLVLGPSEPLKDGV